jgi:hypothetical protein
MVRTRAVTLWLAVLALVGSVGVVLGGSPPAPAGAASAPPGCSFNGSTLPLVAGAVAGKQITVRCSNLPPTHPYLLMETSLLLGIDPQAAPLLAGDVTSVPGLLALLAALPEINPAALTFPVSDSSGNLVYTYSLPGSQAPDPNATCPPSPAEVNDGLIGCALTMIDLTTFKPLGAGSAVIEYTSNPLDFPPAPTLALSKSTAGPGQRVKVSDAPGATTHWWLATLVALESLLGGGAAPEPVIVVKLTNGSTTVQPTHAVAVTPAVYNNPVLTPPAISGKFTVPATLKAGTWKVTVAYHAPLLGFGLVNTASAALTVT